VGCVPLIGLNPVIRDGGLVPAREVELTLVPGGDIHLSQLALTGGHEADRRSGGHGEDEVDGVCFLGWLIRLSYTLVELMSIP